MKAVYFAAPLFSEAETKENLIVVSAIEHFVPVFLPQRDGSVVFELVKEGYTVEEAFQRVTQQDLEAIRNCKILVAVLDGQGIDEGVAFELGYAFGIGKTCIGYQTDLRRKVLGRNNPMVEQALSHIDRETAGLVNSIRNMLMLQ
jgi:nucleoside 2-deoxyribosyltransferase